MTFLRRAFSLPMIRQTGMAECAHACIVMICRALGHEIDLHTLSCRKAPSHQGTTLRDMIAIFTDLGCDTRALRVSLSDMRYIRTPALLHWNMNHFVVLKKVCRKGIIIHDPAMGVRRCTWDVISASFTGIVLEVTRSVHFVPMKGDNKRLTLASLARSIPGFGKAMVWLMGLSLSAELFSLLNPLLIQLITDQVITSNGVHHLRVLALGFAILTMLITLSQSLRGYMLTYVSQKLTAYCASLTMKHLLSLPLAFFEKRHKGDIQTTFQAVEHIQKKMTADFLSTLIDGGLVLIHLAVMMLYSRYLGCIVLLSLVIYTAIRYISYQKLKSMSESSVHEHAQSAQSLLETLQGIMPIKAFSSERSRFTRWQNTYIRALNADTRLARMHVGYATAYHYLFDMEQLGVMCVGAGLIMQHQFSVGMLMAFLAYRSILVSKATSCINQWVEYRLIGIYLDRLGDILFHTPEKILTGHGDVSAVHGRLSLVDVSFQYDDYAKPVLEQVSFELQAGEKVAITGVSGVGKTTLLKVAMGLLPATTGNVLIDGVAIATFGLKKYRTIIASVMQDDALLSGSIIDNIVFFEEDIDEQYVFEVAKIACIHDAILAFPMGYHTLVGDMGSTLSGGQKQRILLARALYKKPKILFLDEATSHLDLANEQSINHALKQLNMTQLIIAHRPETIKAADRVIELK